MCCPFSTRKPSHQSDYQQCSDGIILHTNSLTSSLFCLNLCFSQHFVAYSKLSPLLKQILIRWFTYLFSFNSITDLSNELQHYYFLIYIIWLLSGGVQNVYWFCHCHYPKLALLLLSKSNYVIIGSSVFNWTLRLCISVSKYSAKWKTSKLLQPWRWFVLGLNQTPSV